MKKILLIFLICFAVPAVSVAEEAAENGNSFSFKSLLGKLFSPHSSASTSDQTTSPDTNRSDDKTSEIADKIVDRIDGTNQQGNVPPQNNYMMEMQERTIREGLVRCMYLGKFVEIHTGLSEQDQEDQIKAKRAGELYANLKCNEQLAGYQHIWKGIDQAIGNCIANDDCQNLNPSSGPTKPGPLPSAKAAGGLKN